MDSEADASWLPQYLRELQELCGIDCPTSYKAGVDQAADWVQRWAEARGWNVRRWANPHIGDSVLVTPLGNPRLGRSLLLVAHLDTVYPVGTVAGRPARQEGDRLLAPGACDNKSGLLSGLYGMLLFEGARTEAGDPMANVALFCGGDEETDMKSSLSILADLRPSFDAALVLEAARENGDVVVARKGRGLFVLKVAGRAAHAGVEPHRGANAILAVSQQVIAAQLLNGSRPGLTVNVGIVSGGTGANVVPDAARAEIDVRVSTPADRVFVEAALRAIAAATCVPGTSSRLSGGWLAPPMPPTEGGEELLALASACATRLGFVVDGAGTGGISYANHLAEMGVPVLDGLGPIGGLDHSPDEYVLVSSIVPRTQLLTLIMRHWLREGSSND
jgi:glutamate carboxypeptidase